MAEVSRVPTQPVLEDVVIRLSYREASRLQYILGEVETAFRHDDENMVSSTLFAQLSKQEIVADRSARDLANRPSMKHSYVITDI